jgi:hypothetical protein
VGSRQAPPWLRRRRRSGPQDDSGALLSGAGDWGFDPCVLNELDDLLPVDCDGAATAVVGLASLDGGFPATPRAIHEVTIGQMTGFFED